MLEKYDRGVVSKLYICFRIRDESKIDRNFIKYYFEGGLLNRGLYSIAHEGARCHGLLNVSPKDFFNLKVTLPSIKDQKRIADILDASTSEVANHEIQLAALEKQKRGLMQKLLTGEVRVKT